MVTYKLTLFADCQQFYLQDETTEDDLATAWTKEAGQNLLAVEPGIIGIGTIMNGFVSVELQILETEPPSAFEGWDHVTKCPIALPSGRIAIAGGTDLLEDAVCIETIPGNYRARIHYGNLVLKESDEQRFRLCLWPGSDQNVTILKKVDQYESLPAPSTALV